MPIVKFLTANSGCKPFNLAPQWTKNHISEGKAVEAGEGAHRGDEEVCHRQVHQDVVEMRAELLVLNSTCNSDGIYGCASHEKKEHKC